MNDMGYSSPLSSLCVSTAASELSKAKMYRIKYFSKSWLLSEGAWAIAVLILLNAPFSMSVHLNYTLCLTICSKCLTICAKSGTNLHTKFIVPMKYYMSFLLWGKEIYAIAYILFGSMEIPLLEIMWPNSFPSTLWKHIS